MMRSVFLSVMGCGLFIANNAAAQEASVEVSRQTIKTYPFGDPDPIPNLYQNEAIYPYFRYDGFSHEGESREWEVVELENPYIRVTVLPEVGGKVWGGIEKSTGGEFIYKNDVLKFRDIAARGPWTSGGIEHNFGVYGHAPTTATPVNYLVRENEDGSASVIVGATDWSSRTTWRVTMTVPEDAAYLQIENFWFNPSPLNGLAYHWLNAAVQAREDLQFYFPGDHYIGHGGDAHSWPIDDNGRDLSLYRNNDFGGSKSYHVLGEYTDFFGGYWHDLDFGFGHWGRYEDTSGKKVWIWSLARSGGIWEDLLTDTDGQYVEAQAGRGFNQTNNSSGTPFGPEFFPPYIADRWTETWFPVKETGGISDASRYGVLNVSRSENALEVVVNALQTINDSLIVTADAKPVYGEMLSMGTLEVARRTITLPEGSGTVTVTVAGPELRYTSDEGADDLDRPLRTEVTADSTSAEWLFREGERYDQSREYDRALDVYHEVQDREPTHVRALSRIAELYYRRGQYEQSLEHSSRALELDTYDAGANFIYGIAQRQLGDLVNAMEALGWAARSLEYRTGAYTQMAEIALQEGDFQSAEEYAQRALDFNTYNLSAYEALAISYRKRGREEGARQVLARLMEIDPLNQFARFERYLLDPTRENLTAFASMIREEFPDEVYLELAVQYANRGQFADAVDVLNEGPADPIVQYWLAYLLRDKAGEESKLHLERALSMPATLVFPFRLETLPVLEWAADQETADRRNGWKTQYYLATLYWSKNRTDRAAELFKALNYEPDYAPFYAARAMLTEELAGENDANVSIARDLQKAIELDANKWRAWRLLIIHHGKHGAHEEALGVSSEAYERFPGNDPIGLEHAATLLANEQYAETARVLESAKVLPHEGASRGHRLFERAHVLLAIERIRSGHFDEAVEYLERSKEWPEHLGVGKPFSPDLRLQDYFLAYAYQQLGRERQAEERFREIAAHTAERRSASGVGNYLGALALRELGREAEARNLLRDWTNASDGRDPVAQWALATFSGDVGKAEELSRELAARSAGTGDYALLRTFMEAAE